MGLIAERLAAADVRSASDWLNDDEGLLGYGPITSSGVRMTDRAAFSLPTFWRCVDLLSSSVAQSPKNVIIKVGGQSFTEYRNRPAWLSQPNEDPTYTINDHFAQVALSLLVNGNFFTHVFPYVWDPQVLTVLNPNRVNVKPGPIYELLDEMGRVTRTVGPMEMLHGTWLRPAGALRGYNPISTLSRTIGAAIAAEDFAGRFFGQGASLAFGVEVPGALTEPQKEDLGKSLKKRYAGNANSHAIGVLTGGAKFVPGLAPTPEQAQMLDTRKFAVEETCRPFGVPPAYAGSQEPGAASYASTQTAKEIYQQNAVSPLATRIEPHYGRLLSVPESVSDPTASTQFKFNLDWIVRTDILARYQAHGEGVRGGFLTPDEARNKEDLPPRPGGNQLYMQSQMVPITQLGVTAAVSTAPANGGPQ
jgi:HK97 family phage portal protein